MTDLAKRWLEWSSALVAFPVVSAPVLLWAGKITAQDWLMVTTVLVPAFLALKGVETWRKSE